MVFSTFSNSRFVHCLQGIQRFSAMSPAFFLRKLSTKAQFVCSPMQYIGAAFGGFQTINQSRHPNTPCETVFFRCEPPPMDVSNGRIEGFARTSIDRLYPKKTKNNFFSGWTQFRVCCTVRA